MIQITALTLLYFTMYCALVLLLPTSAMKFASTWQKVKNTHFSNLQTTMLFFRPSLSITERNARRNSFLQLVGSLKASPIDDASIIEDPKTNDLPKFLEDANTLGAVRFGEI